MNVNIGCKKIDFYGDKNNIDSHPDFDNDMLKYSYEIIDNIATQKHTFNIHDKENLMEYCKSRNWINADKKALNISEDETKIKFKCDLNKIPLLNSFDINNGKQYVFGRMNDLEIYYKCPKFFYTLNSTDWDSLYAINDLFVYCSIESTANILPIRIILSQNNLTSLKYDSKITTLPHFLSHKNRIVVLSRELCQLTQYFKLHLYQSKQYSYILFASKYDIDYIKNNIKDIELQEIFIN